jgi:hypothetical protein
VLAEIIQDFVILDSDENLPKSVLKALLNL